jgi:hypothetical protein
MLNKSDYYKLLERLASLEADVRALQLAAVTPKKDGRPRKTQSKPDQLG